MVLREELEEFQRAGSIAPQERELRGADGAIMLQTLAMLDEVAEGKHFHELPLLLIANDDSTRASRYILNRRLFEIHDCFR